MSDSFGNGPFGRRDWSYNLFVGALPDVYRQTDAQIDGGLVDFIESVIPSFDYIYDKITSFQDLRDPLKCQTDSAFVRAVVILRVVNLNNGTSRVFLSQNSDGLAFNGVRLGYTLKDYSGSKFNIIELNASGLPDDYSNPPIDPYTGNPTGKNIIVSNIAADGIEIIPLVSGVGVTANDQATISYTFLNPNDISFSTDGSHAYIANFGSNTVIVVKTSDMTVVKTVVVGNAPQSSVVLPNGQYIYVINFTDNTVSVIRAADNAVVATVPVGVGPSGGVASPDSSHVYILNYGGGSGSVSVIRTSDNTVVATPAVGGNSQNIVIAPDGSHVYVANNNGNPNGVTVIRTSDNTTVALTGLGNPSWMSINPSGLFYYVPDSSGGVVRVLRASDNALMATVTVGGMGSSPVYSVVAPDGAHVYVSITDNTVAVIRTSDNTVVASPSVGAGVYASTVTPDSAYIYASNYTDSTVSVIRSSDNTVISTVTVGSGPSAIAAESGSQYVYVGNYTDSDVSVIRVSDNTVVKTITSGTSGGVVTDPADFLVSPLNNGSNAGPYVCALGLPPIINNLIKVTWHEGGDPVVGYFENNGNHYGQLGVGSAVNYNSGTVTVVPASGGIIDNHTINIRYTTALAESLHPVTSPLIDGANVGPYVYTLPLDPIANYKVTLFWTESSVEKVGSFDSSGVPVSSLHSSSTINFTTGNISFKSVTGNPIDQNSLSIWYLPVSTPLAADSKINSPNLLVYLGDDFDMAVDQNEPESYQRSSVYNAYQLWDIKGSERAYSYLGKMHGFTVNARQLYKTNGGFPYEYIFPGIRITEVPGADPHGSIIPPNDGVNTSFVITLAFGKVYTYSPGGFTISWTESGAAKSVVYYQVGMSVTTTGDVSSLTSISNTPYDNVISVTFNGAHIPDANSIVISFTQASFYTTKAPFTLVMDEVVLDAIPLDTYCFDNDFPIVRQQVTVSNASVITEHEDGSKRWTAVATITGLGGAWLTFNTEATWLGTPIENFKRLSNSTYSFEVVQNGSPNGGPAMMSWHVLKNLPVVVIDTPGVTPGATISPTPNGSALGPFTIHLANHPIYLVGPEGGNEVILNYKIGGTPRVVDINSGSVVTGPGASDIASASVNVTTGVVTVTFTMGNPPDANSLTATYSPLGDINIVGLGTDLTAIGTQYAGYSGIRYRLRTTMSDSINMASVGNWKIMDANGVQSWIESFKLISSSPYVYDIDFISNTVPASGPANIFYSCVEIPECNYCAASAILITMDANDILNHPSDYFSSGQAAASLQSRIREILPAHVRVVEFIDYTTY